MLNKTRIITVFALGTMSMALSACETLEGAGKDVENAGQSIQSAANS